MKLFFLSIFAACAYGGLIPTARPTFSNDVSNGRIIGGHPATVNQIPYQVSVRSHTTDGGSSLCGGSLISTLWVLTAARCTNGFIIFTLGFGSNSLNNPMLPPITAGKREEHPDYNPTTFHNDISLIQLPYSIVTNQAIQVIRLPRMSQCDNTLHDLKMRISGWGRMSNGGNTVDILQWVDVRTIRNEVCTDYYGKDIIVPSIICGFGFEENHRGICDGDFGGPLVFDEAGIYTQIGIASFASKNGCDSGDPSLYTRTAPYLSWISSIANITIRP